MPLTLRKARVNETYTTLPQNDTGLESSAGLHKILRIACLLLQTFVWSLVANISINTAKDHKADRNNVCPLAVSTDVLFV